MNLDEDSLNSLHDDLEVCRDYIKQIAMGMIKGGVSQYPIFVAMRGEMDIDLGVPIVSRADFDITWNLNASHLEDFVNKGVIKNEKSPDFVKSYKNPNEFMCVFVAEEGMAGFVYMPYDKRRELLN